MFETDAELEALQAMLDLHMARANEHMLAIVKPERRLTARQVATYLQGTPPGPPSTNPTRTRGATSSCSGSSATRCGRMHSTPRSSRRA